MKKEVKKGRNVGKNLRMCSGRRGIRKWGGSPWNPGKGSKKFLKFFLKRVQEMCVENTYVVRLKNEKSTRKKESGKGDETSEEKDEDFPREKDEFPREYWTLYPVYLNP